MKGGFSLIELMVVILIISILVSFAVPSFYEAKKSAEAAKVITDFEVIRDAVVAYYADYGKFPPDMGPGIIPKDLKKYLPKGFKFDYRPKRDIRYDWENWVVNNKPKHPKTGILYGISLTTKDKALVKKVKGIFRGAFQYSLNNNYTFVLEYISK
ncbi:MAG: Prepilin-type N-terminal cleavage/methylation domain-containing protein [candidate division TA06 bacterium 32_111]|uniref:Prepilin-type N-terminal cleavage/methylation domain-containing protein n=2 Tax=Bacteria candidate phyla TaxID=1783234 RepID=A0A101I426_UNCT6|nr:MAG: Prepilin-type N-terminal cleavage/methylation domain-containing protein [candidate division TA06 bacterium 32_111]KUK88159.1 MAG: Prepilin-type N-terminal cleavage/methylation domain-containing protein [candidate division TA06 bacterium 34_109]HAF07089.1 hypothetical protein [candidate division WOR-3 bacterium]HCP17164.1 hypothetical protein [candidate division WOR-3 bacterium]